APGGACPARPAPGRRGREGRRAHARRDPGAPLGGSMMWSRESAWRRRREGPSSSGPSELSGQAYYAIIADQVRQLEDTVQAFLDGHVEMEEEERDDAIRERIVRPAVQEYNRRAERSEEHTSELQ